MSVDHGVYTASNDSFHAITLLNNIDHYGQLQVACQDWKPTTINGWFNRSPSKDHHIRISSISTSISTINTNCNSTCDNTISITNANIYLPIYRAPLIHFSVWRAQYTEITWCCTNLGSVWLFKLSLYDNNRHEGNHEIMYTFLNIHAMISVVLC